MNATKEELINFLEENIFLPIETNFDKEAKIKRKINTTRVRLNSQKSAEQVRLYFLSAMATDNGIDSYKKISNIVPLAFDDIRDEFKKLFEDK